MSDGQGFIIGLRLRDTLGPLIRYGHHKRMSWKQIQEYLVSLGHQRLNIDTLRRLCRQWEKSQRDGWTAAEQMARDMNGEICG